MTTKTFCDCCGKIIEDRSCVRVELPLQQVGSLIVEARHHEGNDVCLYCIVDAFKKLDDRPEKPLLYNMIPRLATLEMVSSVDHGASPHVTDQFLQRAWQQMYDAAIKTCYVPTMAPAEPPHPLAALGELVRMMELIMPTRRIVPIEPDERMLAAGNHVGGHPPHGQYAQHVWCAMLGAVKL